jgi:caffeoyl-CoA O-methyltransferase
LAGQNAAGAGQSDKANIKRAGLSSKVEIRIGNAINILPLLEQEQAGPFDLVFIDADKPPYAEYFEWAIRLGRPGTIIVADNVIRNGKVLDPHSADEKVKGVQRLNAMLAKYPGVTATILQTVGVKEYDGMVVAVINHSE